MDLGSFRPPAAFRDCRFWTIDASGEAIIIIEPWGRNSPKASTGSPMRSSNPSLTLARYFSYISPPVRRRSAVVLDDGHVGVAELVGAPHRPHIVRSGRG